MKLMILGDDPNRSTGFARVVRNLLQQWLAMEVFEEIHIWGVNYTGLPHDWPKHVRIYPAAGGIYMDWSHIENLKRFGALLQGAGITHLFMVQDVWTLLPLSKLIRNLRFEKGLVSTLYFPCDAPFEPFWMEILLSVDYPVAYCKYGIDQAEDACLHLQIIIEEEMRMGKLPKEFDPSFLNRVQPLLAHGIKCLPHGVDDVFRFSAHPKTVNSLERRAMRRRFLPEVVTESNFLIVNVSANQRRKGLLQTLQLFRNLDYAGFGGQKNAVLYLHCPSRNSEEQSDLEKMAHQLELGDLLGKRIFFGDAAFTFGRAMGGDDLMRDLYLSADLFLSTTLGEGWGLPVTEAMACGLPVAAPAHTSLVEILGGGALGDPGLFDRGTLLPLLGQGDVVPGDNSRIRYRVDTALGARMLLRQDPLRAASVATCAREWIRDEKFSWRWIAQQWLHLMLEGTPPDRSLLSVSPEP